MRIAAGVIRVAGPAVMGGVLFAAAQTPTPAPTRPSAVFSSDVKLVAVPVFVSRDGKAVSGLTASDFEVEDQGRKVPIAGFLAVDAGASGTIPAGAENASASLLAASRRQLLLLFDLTFSTSRGILEARQAALELLQKSLQPGDLVSVASLGQGGARVLVGFTSDHAQAGQAIATLGGAEGTRLRDPLGLAYDLGFQVGEGSGAWGIQMREGSKDEEENRDRLLQAMRAERAQYRQRVTGFVVELRKLTELLDSVKGRKQVVLLSGGFDDSMLLGAEGAERAESARSVSEGRLWEVQSDRHFGDASTSSTLSILYDGLARTDTVIHTVDLGALAAGASPDEQGSVRPGGGRQALAQIAGQSGGQFVGGTNDLARALRDVLDASRYYYVLAFEPSSSRKKADELRKLKIKVQGGGLQVSHRAGYTVPEPGPADPAPRQLQAAESIAKGLSGGAIGLRAVAVPHRNANGTLSLPVVLQVDGESLLLGGGKKPMLLEVYGYALDAKGRVQDAFGLGPTLDMEKVGALVKEKGVQVLAVFRVPAGPTDLRFLVRDPASGRTGSLRVTTTASSFSKDVLAVSPPLFMDDPSTRVVVPALSRLGPDLQIPYRVGDAPFTLDADPVLRNGGAREVCLMTFGGDRLTAASLRVGAELTREGGQPLPVATGPTRVVDDPDGMQRVVFTLTPAGIPKGDYRLRVALTAGAGGASARSELPVRID